MFVLQIVRTTLPKGRPQLSNAEQQPLLPTEKVLATIGFINYSFELILCSSIRSTDRLICFKINPGAKRFIILS